jgi:HEAT repeat protein
MDEDDQRLIDRLRYGDEDAREGAASRLAVGGPRQRFADPALIERLDDTPSVAATVIFALREIGLGEHANSHEFIAKLTGPSAELRWRSVRSVTYVDDQCGGSVLPLLSLLDDPDDRVVDWAAGLILPGRSPYPFRPGATGLAIRAALAGLARKPACRPGWWEGDWTRLRLAMTLVGLFASDDSEGRDPEKLALVARSEDTLLCLAAIVGLSWLGAPAVGTLERLASGHPLASARRLVAIAAGRTGDGACGLPVGVLIELLGDGSAGVRREASMSLGSRGGAAAAVPVLRGRLRDAEAEVRLWAARALGGIGLESEETAGALLEALRGDPDEGVRGAAARSYAAMVKGRPSHATAEAVAALVDGMRSARDDFIGSCDFEDSFYRLSDILREEGLGLPDVGYVKGLLGDYNPEVRKMARTVLDSHDLLDRDDSG